VGATGLRRTVGVHAVAHAVAIVVESIIADRLDTDAIWRTDTVAVVAIDVAVTVVVAVVVAVGFEACTRAGADAALTQATMLAAALRFTIAVGTIDETVVVIVFAVAAVALHVVAGGLSKTVLVEAVHFAVAVVVLIVATLRFGAEARRTLALLGVTGLSIESTGAAIAVFVEAVGVAIVVIVEPVAAVALFGSLAVEIVAAVWISAVNHTVAIVVLRIVAKPLLFGRLDPAIRGAAVTVVSVAIVASLTELGLTCSVSAKWNGGRGICGGAC
jgi:hypothetical protein